MSSFAVSSKSCIPVRCIKWQSFYTGVQHNDVVLKQCYLNYKRCLGHNVNKDVFYWVYSPVKSIDPIHKVSKCGRILPLNHERTCLKTFLPSFMKSLIPSCFSSSKDKASFNLNGPGMFPLIPKEFNWRIQSFKLQRYKNSKIIWCQLHDAFTESLAMVSALRFHVLWSFPKTPSTMKPGLIIFAVFCYLTFSSCMTCHQLQWLKS